MLNSNRLVLSKLCNKFELLRVIKVVYFSCKKISKVLVFFFLLSFLLISSLSTYAQCTFGGTNSGVVVTPTVSPQFTSTISAGDYFLMNVVNGGVYTIRTCTGTTFDTQLTVYDTVGTFIVFNDDSCGLRSEVSFTAGFTGQVRVMLNQFNCATTTNSTTVEYYGGLVSCTSQSSSPSTAIPDNNATGISQTVSFTSTASIADVNVTLNITHTFDADLEISLTSPAGTTINLTSDNGGGGDDFTGTIFDDSAGTAVTAGTAPFTGSFRPEQALSNFNGENPNGVWTLTVVDDAGGDIGTLDSFSIEVCEFSAVTSTDIAVTKVVDDTTPNEGDNITYTLEVDNNGPNQATNLTLTDLLPAGVTYVSDDGPYASGTGIWTIGTLNAGSIATLNIVASVNAGTAGSTITNTVTALSADQTDSDATADDLSEAIIVNNTTDLVVTKTVNDTTPKEGDDIAYTLMVTNNGPLQATNLTITDALPAGVTYVSDDGAYVPGTGVWTIGTLNSGSTATLNIVASIDAGTGGSTITNTISALSADQADSNVTADDLSEAINPTADQPPVVTAAGNQFLCPGPGNSENIVISISITDPDDTTTDAVYIQISSGYVTGEDVLTLTSPGSHPSITATFDAVQGELALQGPATFAEFEAAVLDVVYSSSNTAATGTRQFSITPGTANYLPPTDHYYEFVTAPGISWTAANAAANARTLFGLQGYLATLTTQAEADFSGSQATGVGWIGATDVATEGDWRWVTGPEGLANGGTGTPFWLGNGGGTVVAPTNFAFWNPPNEPNNVGGGGEDYAHITDNSIGPLGSWNDLPNGGGGGAYASQGYVVEYGGTPGDPVLSISATTMITLSCNADLSLTKTVDNASPSVGDTIIFTITIDNNGPDSASGIQVRDILPAGLINIVTTPSVGTYTVGTGIWDLGSTMNSGDSETLTISVEISPQCGTITNTAEIISSSVSDADSTPGNGG